MLEQTQLMAAVKELVKSDNRVRACMMYGSFTKGEGDQYSDIEYYIFLKDNTIEFDADQWLGKLAPHSLFYKNAYGTDVVIFHNLIRGEFHFLSEKEMNILPSFKASGPIPDATSMFVYDETGKLKGYLDQLEGPGPDRLIDDNVNYLLADFCNLWLMGINVLLRGEKARSLEQLTRLQKNIIQLIRIVEANAHNWFNATRNLEKEISQEYYRKYQKTTARLIEPELYEAYVNSLLLVKELRAALNESYRLTVSNELLNKLLNYIKK